LFDHFYRWTGGAFFEILSEDFLVEGVLGHEFAAIVVRRVVDADHLILGA